MVVPFVPAPRIAVRSRAWQLRCSSAGLGALWWDTNQLCGLSFGASVLVCSFLSVLVPGWTKHPCTVAVRWGAWQNESHNACSFSASAGDGFAAQSPRVTAHTSGEVISFAAKRQHHSSPWDLVVTFRLAAGSMPHCCCPQGSNLWLLRARVSLHPLPSPSLDLCASTSTCCCQEWGSSTSAASISMKLELVLNFSTCVVAMPLCFNPWKNDFLENLLFESIFIRSAHCRLFFLEQQSHTATLAVQWLMQYEAAVHQSWQSLLLSHPARCQLGCDVDNSSCVRIWFYAGLGPSHAMVQILMAGICVHTWLCHGWAHTVVAAMPLFARGIQIEAHALFGAAESKSHLGSTRITQRWSLSALVLGLIAPCSRIVSWLVLTVLKLWFWLSFPLAMDFPPHILLQRDRCVWKTKRGT